MKRIVFLLTAFLSAAGMLLCGSPALPPVHALAAGSLPAENLSAGTPKDTLADQLSALDGVIGVEEIALASSGLPFEAKYIVTFCQPLDWKHPEVGTFPQRVELGYNSAAHINAMNTEGYSLQDALFATGNVNDLVRHYGANYIHPEHRFFGCSAPDDLSYNDTRYWEYMTSENAAGDLHKIYTELSKVLGDVWFCYGISYGGLMTNIYAHSFPDDMRLYIPCVAPCALSTHDKRMYDFIYNEIGDAAFGAERGAYLRKLMTDFQVELMKNKEDLLPQYERYIANCGYSFRKYATPDRLFDLNVLEFALQLWQYSQDEFPSMEVILGLPENTEEEREQKLAEELSLLLRVQSFTDWACNIGFWPYYVHTQLQIGRQYYDFSYLRKALEAAGLPDTLSIREEDEETLLADMVFTKKQKKAFSYDHSFCEAMTESIDTTAAKYLMLFGATDPWTSLRIHETGNENVKVYMHPTGTHRNSGIGDFAGETQDEMWALIDSCLEP